MKIAFSITRLMILVAQNDISKGNEHGCKPIPQQQILKVYPEAPDVGLARNHREQSVHSEGRTSGDGGGSFHVRPQRALGGETGPRVS